MADSDLSGNDLKYVSYSVLFTKRDYEAVLWQETEDLVNYDTNGASYGALKIADFFKRVAAGEVKRPALWKELAYPPEDQGELLTGIPAEDQKYVRFTYQVDEHIARSDSEYERDQTRALQKIAGKM